MKKITSLAGFLFLLTMGFSLQAQSDDNYVQQWKHIAEDKQNHTEFEYAVINCGGTPKIILNVFNELGEAKQVNFQLDITNSDGRTKKIAVEDWRMKPGEMARGGCDSKNKWVNYAIPQGFEASTLDVKVQLNQ